MLPSSCEETDVACFNTSLVTRNLRAKRELSVTFLLVSEMTYNVSSVPY